MIKSPIEFQSLERKTYTKSEITILVGEHMQSVLDPIMKEIGQTLEAFHARLSELEETTNGLIREMKEWKAQQRILQ